MNECRVTVRFYGSRCRSATTAVVEVRVTEALKMARLFPIMTVSPLTYTRGSPLKTAASHRGASGLGKCTDMKAHYRRFLRRCAI